MNEGKTIYMVATDASGIRGKTVNIVEYNFKEEIYRTMHLETTVTIQAKKTIPMKNITDI